MFICRVKPDDSLETLNIGLFIDDMGIDTETEVNKSLSKNADINNISSMGNLEPNKGPKMSKFTRKIYSKVYGLGIILS